MIGGQPSGASERIRAACLAVLDAGMRATHEGHAHVMVDYAGHVEWLCVNAYPRDQKYALDNELVSLISLRVPLSLDWHGGIEPLLRELADCKREIDALGRLEQPQPDAFVDAFCMAETVENARERGEM